MPDFSEMWLAVGNSNKNEIDEAVKKKIMYVHGKYSQINKIKRVFSRETIVALITNYHYIPVIIL